MIFKSTLLIFLAICFATTNGFQSELNVNQINHFLSHGFDNNFKSNQDFKTIDDVIKDAKLKMNKLMIAQTIPGAVIGFSINGSNVWTEGFGYTDIENDVKTHKDSVWRLASVSKPLTAALIGQLMDQNQINLDDNIHKFLPKDFYPDKIFNGSQVNLIIRQVMSHMAGLHMTKVPDDFNQAVHAQNVSQTIAQFKNEPLLFKPGTNFSYSNYGTQLAGAIIEAIFHDKYETQIYKMFQKLGMNLTFAEKRETIIKHRPQYYMNSTEKPGKLQRVDMLDDLWAYEGWWPSGGMVSTVSDLLTFGNAMISSYHGHNDDFLSSDTVKKLWTPETQGLMKPPWVNYAKYWMVTDVPDTSPYPYKQFMSHSGGLLGTSTQLTVFPKQNIVGVAFANIGNCIGLDTIILKVAQNFKDFI